MKEDYIMSDDKDKRIAWEKLSYVPDKNPKIWRRDKDGNLIRFTSYGTAFGQYGWKIEHTGQCDGTCKLRAVKLQGEKI
jgi:hypothetical protein